MITLEGRKTISEQELFKKVILSEIGPRSPTLCKFSLELLDGVPSYFWVESATSSGKRHPMHDLGEGGLARHSLMTYRWMKSLAESLPEETIYEAMPAMVTATLFHDCCKRGMPGQPVSDHTLFEHPILSAKFILDKSQVFILHNKEFIDSTVEGEDYFKEQVSTVISCVQSHMGKWTTNPKVPDIVLPLPKTMLQNLVHLADYCASRKFTTFDVAFFNQIVEQNDGKNQ